VAILNFKIPDEILKRIEIEAKAQKATVLEIIRRAIDAYLRDEDVSEEELLGNIEKMIGESVAGESRDADDVLEELELELAQESLNRILLLSAKTQELELSIDDKSLEELNSIAQEQSIEISELILITLELYFGEEEK
jgi:hypothetical protein